MACLAGILCFLSCAKDVQDMTGTLHGFVSDYAQPNMPLAGVSVTVNGKGLSKTTGSDGRYEFPDLDPGTYTLSASADGYQTTTKQVTIYAGQTANCDFQLSRASSQVTVSPLTLAFGTDIDQLTLTISNNNSSSMQYSITDYPDCITVSPASATVAGKGKQTVTVRINRDLVDKNISTSLLVNVGNDSYPVSVTIGHHEAQSKLSVSESLLDFGQQYSELQLTLKNTGTAGNISWSIDAPSVNCLTVNPDKGELAMGKEAKVTVRLDRTKMEADLQTFLTINAAGGSTSVQVLASKKASGGDDNGGETGGEPEGENVVRNALYAYFTFNGEVKDLTETGVMFTDNTTTFTDSYNGSKALKITASGSLSVPEGMVDQKNSSVTFWAKDLYDGHVFHVENSGKNSVYVLAVVNGRIRFVRSEYNCTYLFDSMQSFSNTTLEGWHHIALVAADNRKLLYVDGLLCDQLTENINNKFNNGIRFVLGGSLQNPFLNATTLILDNLRIYKYRAITAEEVATIYNYEK